MLGEMMSTALAQCLVRLGRFEDAEATMQRNLGRLVEAIAPEHFERRLYLNTLAEIHKGLGQHDKAHAGEKEASDY